ALETPAGDHVMSPLERSIFMELVYILVKMATIPPRYVGQYAFAAWTHTGRHRAKDLRLAMASNTRSHRANLRLHWLYYGFVSFVFIQQGVMAQRLETTADYPKG
ncbi:hypothetical protein FOZ62_022114, partial [Perkinsus olseni]